MNHVNIEWDWKELFAGLDRLETHEVALIEAGARLIALDGLAEMVKEAPILTGHLRGSHSCFVNSEFMGSGPLNTEGPSPTPAMRSGERRYQGATLIVWGANTNYAARRHENPAEGTRGGAGFWMTRVMRNRMRKWMELLAERMRAGRAGA